MLNFQQTILGPVWLLVQPVLTLVIYVFVFGRMIGLSKGMNLPPVLFYFSGIILWNFFNDTFSGVSRTFRDNVHLFSKVYFPRIIMPLANSATHLIRFSIQVLVLLILVGWYDLTGTYSVSIGWWNLLFPLAVLAIGLLSFSLGLIVSIITAKYRDIANLVDVCIRLLFFITPVLYPITYVKEDLRWVVSLNPLTPLFELARVGLYNEGAVSSGNLLYATGFIGVSLLTALLVFNKKSNTLIDVI